MALFNPSRDEVRQFFFETWRKFRSQEALTPMESLALQAIHQHPEYHPVLDAPERYLGQEYFPAMGETNPFLHLSLHVSILEQLSIDQPPGIAALCTRLAGSVGEHEAQHAVMECLAEVLWTSQRTNTPPDGETYLECLRRKAR